MLFRSIARFIKKLQKRNLRASKEDIRLAEKLLSFHKESSDFSRLPEYRFEDLRKGILCAGCLRYYQDLDNTTLVCSFCGHKERCHDAVLRTADEFKLLFPNERLTTNSIFEMCEIIKNKRTVRRILSKKYRKIGHGKYSSFIDFEN